MVKQNQKRERRFTDEFYSNVEEDAKEGRIRGKARFVSGKFTLMKEKLMMTTMMMRDYLIHELFAREREREFSSSSLQ